MVDRNSISNSCMKNRHFSKDVYNRKTNNMKGKHYDQR